MQNRLLYNVTVTLDVDIHLEWLDWMRTVHIPDVMATGMFLSYRLLRLTQHEHADSEIYAIQYTAPDQAHLDQYLTQFAPALQQAHRERYQGKFAAFRTFLEVLEESP